MEKRNRHSAKRNASRSDSEIQYPAEKCCSVCKETKLAAAFSRARREKDGLKSNCKGCAKAQRRSWYVRNAEREKQKAEEWQRANPEKKKLIAKKTYYKNHASRKARLIAAYRVNKGKISRQQRERYNSDPEFRQNKMARAKQYYKRSKPKIAEYKKKLQREQPEKLQAWANSARIKRAAASGKCTADEWQEILEYFNYHCAYCLQHESMVGRLSMDHMTPITRGGDNSPDNIVPACKPCNSSKYNLTVLEYLGSMNIPRKDRTIIAV
jgi:5-methylcytosine-specific restriction endonuclease McrA